MARDSGIIEGAVPDDGPRIVREIDRLEVKIIECAVFQVGIGCPFGVCHAHRVWTGPVVAHSVARSARICECNPTLILIVGVKGAIPDDASVRCPLNASPDGTVSLKVAVMQKDWGVYHQVSSGSYSVALDKVQVADLPLERGRDGN